MGILSHHDILELREAVIAAGLAESRAALLVGINREFAASMRSAPSPGEQMFCDLDALCAAGSLQDGSIPLLSWLANAMALTGGRREAIVFQRALRRAQELLLGHLPQGLLDGEPSEQRHEGVILKLELKLDRALVSFDERALMRELSILLGAPVTGVHITELRSGSVIVCLEGDPEVLERTLRSLSEPSAARQYFVKMTGLVEAACHRSGGAVIRVSMTPAERSSTRRPERSIATVKPSASFSEADLVDLNDYLTLDLNALYSLVPPYLPRYQSTMFNPSGQRAAGQEEFEALRSLLEQRICADWGLCERLDEAVRDDEASMVLAIAEVISALPTQVPPLLLASIIVKLGPRTFCRCLDRR